MTHLVYCDNVGKKGERPIDKILAGIKTMVVRGAAEKNGRTVTEQKAKTKKCLYCNKMIDLDTDDACLVGVGTRWAHKECYEKYFSADDQWIDKLYGVLKVAFGKYDFQKIERQRIPHI